MLLKMIFCLGDQKLVQSHNRKDWMQNFVENQNEKILMHHGDEKI